MPSHADLPLVRYSEHGNRALSIPAFAARVSRDGRGGLPSTADRAVHRILHDRLPPLVASRYEATDVLEV